MLLIATSFEIYSPGVVCRDGCVNSQCCSEHTNYGAGRCTKDQHCPGVIPNGNIAHRCLVANNKSTPEKPEVRNCVCRHEYAHPKLVGPPLIVNN